jgi:hypothetical protein
VIQDETPITPGMLVLISPTPTGHASASLAAQYDMDKSATFEELGKPGIFLILRDDLADEGYGPPPAWMLSYVAGNKYAAGDGPDPHNESIMFQDVDQYCTVVGAARPDDQSSVDKLFKMLEGQTDD